MLLVLHVEGACCLPMSFQSSDKFWSVNHRRRIQGIGLPFLLTMRAFMGIGEVGLFCFFLVLLCFTGLEENSFDKSFGVCVLSLDIILDGLYAVYRNHFW